MKTAYKCLKCGEVTTYHKPQYPCPYCGYEKMVVWRKHSRSLGVKNRCKESQEPISTLIKEAVNRGPIENMIHTNITYLTQFLHEHLRVKTLDLVDEIVELCKNEDIKYKVSDLARYTETAWTEVTSSQECKQFVEMFISSIRKSASDWLLRYHADSQTQELEERR